MRCYTLYIGSRSADHAEADAALVASITASRFRSFTLFEGSGWFRGRREQVSMVKIATDDYDSVFDLARDLRARLDQDGIGLEYDGFYHRVTKADDASAST